MTKTKQDETAPDPGQPIKLNKSNVDSISQPGIYPDSELMGFRLRVGPTGVKSYQLIGKAKGNAKQKVFCTIGKHGQPWTADGARTEAKRLRLILQSGENPNEEAKEKARTKKEQVEKEQALIEAKQAVRDVTLKTAMGEHFKKGQKPSTVRGYQKVSNAHLKDWLNKPLTDITEDDVIERFDEIHQTSPSSAAHTMRFLKAVFKTARARYGKKIPALAAVDPTITLTTLRPQWNSLDPREDYIPDECLPSFYKAVTVLESKTARDYLLVAILTGLRHTEICTLRWDENIDLKSGVITLKGKQTKNKKAHTLAMSNYLYQLFLHRWQLRGTSPFVFPGREDSKTGHYDDPEKSINQVVKAIGVKFTSHSLRRTFATALDGLGYDLRNIQRLLNHAPSSVADKHYIQRHVEKTREPMQRVNDHLLTLMGVKAQQEAETDNVVPLARTAG